LAAAAEASPLPSKPSTSNSVRPSTASIAGTTAADLLDKLNDVCSDADRKQRWFPNTASQVGSALRRVAPLLRSRGIEFAPHKDRDKKTHAPDRAALRLRGPV